MQNDGYPPGNFDPLKAGPALGVLGWWAMLSNYTFPIQAHDRVANLEQARSLGAQAPTIAPSLARRRRLRQMLSRFWEVAQWRRHSRAAARLTSRRVTSGRGFQ